MFIIGAGFSAPGGLPLGKDLFPEIRRRAARLGATALEADIDRYCLYIERATGQALPADDVNFEKFMSFLDVEHYLRLDGSDTWTNEGNESQNLVRTIIAEILCVAQQAMPRAAVDLYDEFARRLHPNEQIVTFNYDTVLEDALDRQGRRYRLYPSRYGVIANWPDEEIAIVKLHGSIDWFDIEPYREDQAHKQEIGSEAPSEHPIFGHGGLPHQKIVDDEAELWHGSDLHRVYRSKNLAEYLRHSMLTVWPPLIISPSFSKILYVNPLREFWNGMKAAGRMQRHVTIIGFSLPAHDEHIRQVLYSVTQGFESFDGRPHLVKDKLRFVDHRRTEEGRAEHRKTYRFVDWSRAAAWYEGLSISALDFIFPAKK